MKLKKVLSGGQTGADQTGIEEAAANGFETGGTMPKGFRTEAGPRPEWAAKYGLTEHSSPDYPPRTEDNVRDSDLTVWFGNTNSAGYKCTRKAAKKLNKPFAENPIPSRFRELSDLYEIINIAGNRASTNPQVIGLVKEAFKAIEI